MGLFYKNYSIDRFSISNVQSRLEEYGLRAVIYWGNPGVVHILLIGKKSIRHAFMEYLDYIVPHGVRIIYKQQRFSFNKEILRTKKMRWMK